MKKMLLAACCAGLAFNASAEGVDVATHTVEHAHPAYEGFYYGAGIYAEKLGLKADYYGSNGRGGNIFNRETTTLGGTILVGFGKKMPSNQFYAGIEVGYDFGSNSNMTEMDKIQTTTYAQNLLAYDVYGKRVGSVPNVAIRLGYVDCHSKMLSYLKVSGKWSKASITHDSRLGQPQLAHGAAGALNGARLDSLTASVSGITPSVAIGVEKAFGKKGTIRSELEYTFGRSNTVNAHFGAGDVSLKLDKKDTIAFRTVLCYNVKIGR